LVALPIPFPLVPLTFSFALTAALVSKVWSLSVVFAVAPAISTVVAPLATPAYAATSPTTEIAGESATARPDRGID
jgi:hypothetical protein